MPLLILAPLVVLAAIVLLPLSIVQRFRVGTRQQIARRWVATLNLFAVAFSACLFIVSAVATSVWVPAALPYTAAGLAAGALLGLLGLTLTRWELRDARWYYTPNRILILTITVLVAARILYGFWRIWETSRASPGSLSSLAPSALPNSLSAGAVVIGYYLVFWAGVRRRIRALR